MVLSPGICACAYAYAYAYARLINAIRKPNWPDIPYSPMK
jgi:hypothetical protein